MKADGSSEKHQSHLVDGVLGDHFSSMPQHLSVDHRMPFTEPALSCCHFRGHMPCWELYIQVKKKNQCVWPL